MSYYFPKSGMIHNVLNKYVYKYHNPLTYR